jgi:lipopolysaccharide export system protein LptA
MKRLPLAAPLVAPLVAATAFALLPGSLVRAQGVDMSHGGPVEITSSQGMEWRQQEQEVIARGDARAVRGDVTVTADELIAFYRKKAAAGTPAAAQPAPGNPPQSAPQNAPVSAVDTGDNEIYRLEAKGHVNIYTPTDHAVADHAIYDIDQAVLVLTGHDLKITTPQDVLTARDVIEYWSQKHMGVGRGEATVTTNDGRRIYADTLVSYTRPPDQKGADQKGADQKAGPAAQPVAATPGKPGGDSLAGSNKLEKVDAFGNVEVRTQTEVIHGDRGTYAADTDMARIVGHVHITRGLNQLNGDEALVNMRTGVSTLSRAPTGQRVEGLVVPNDASGPNTQAGAQAGTVQSGGAPGASKPAKKP